jgi:hypothetical protein
MSPQDLEGTWVMKTRGDGFHEHELKIAVDGDSRVVGTWRHVSSSGGQSAIEGRITGDHVQLHRTSSSINQTFVGRCTPTFAGGTYSGTGVWFMEKQ